MNKEKRNKLLIGIFIAFIMISSTIGFFYGSEQSKKYNGYSFSQTENGWTTYIKDRKQYWSFDYLPNELNFETNIGSIPSNVLVSINDQSSFYDISKKFALLGILAKRTNVEDINCTSTDTTLIFIEKEFNKIYKEDQCVYFEGDTNKLIDSLFYHILGVM